MMRWTLPLLMLLALAAPAIAQTPAGPTTAPAAPPVTSPPATPPVLDARAAFNAALDLDAFSRLAVHREGRVKSLESFAREMIGYVTGPRSYEGQPAIVTYFDLMMRPEAYADADILYVKGKVIRAQIADVLQDSMREDIAAMRARDPSLASREAAIVAELDERLRTFVKRGLISQPMLLDPRVQELLGRLERDLLRSAKYVRAIESAMAVRRPAVLRGNLRVVPPFGGAFDAGWHTLDEVTMPGVAPEGSELVGRLDGAWSRFQLGWLAGDAGVVNAAAAELAAALPQVSPELYPAQTRLAWEGRYFRLHNMTWVWILYAFALVPLLLMVVFRWRGAGWIGLGLFTTAFALHTFAVMLRWYVSGRWPNTNMFEAITTAAWFGGCLALVLEVFLRRSPMRGLLAVGSSAASMVALMAAHYMPLELNPNVSNMMPVLNDLWLYIHTNVIIFSYALIFMASVSAGLYLLFRIAKTLRGQSGVGDHARVGGAASLIMTSPDGTSYLGRPKTTIGQVLDGTTMILIEVSFVLLWAGLVMGAIWADHSWGRPWGWDPKEVFALNTFVIFALLIHVRLKVRDKGLWTALLAIVGCAVMLFNWVVINFTISGLHSYA